MPDLRAYRAKRDPERTPEPFGEDAQPQRLAPAAARAFVVQQHAARAMHWDLRLEIDGVLASWAVPRGPSLDPRERRLAVRTEDHPIEYADFEGLIPAGNYGAGAMIVWDRGAYHTVEGEAPAKGLEAGKLDLVLRGHKLGGRFALVRTKGEGGRQWLLLRKGRAAPDGEEIIEREPGSVLSGLTVQEIAAGVTRDEEIAALARAANAPRRALARDERLPMLASTVDDAFSREGWIFELKYDGWRVIAERGADGSARLFSRNRRDLTNLFPEVALAVRHLPLAEFVIDGEVTALDPAGRSSFGRLQQRLQADPGAVARARVEQPVVMFAFDLLAAAGHDLRRLALVQRKELLARLVPRLGFVRFADHVEGDGQALFEAAGEHGMEGVIAKRADSPYQSGARSKSWLKIKVPHTSLLLVAGISRGKGSRRKLGSLVLAWWQDGRLVYAGNAGSGLDERTIAELLPELEAAATPEPRFEGAPEGGWKDTLFVEPRVVCRVRYTERTDSGVLRHPVFMGLARDASPQDCTAPASRDAAPEPAAGAPPPIPAPELVLTRLEKVFWPVEGYTKGDLLAYYDSIWPWLEPYLRDRPVVLTRYPDGIEGKSFYQKNAPEFTPDWARREQIEGTDYFVCNDLRTLLYVINSGAIPLHVWSARIGSLERPDWLILDLDPKEAPFAHVVRIARHIHALLDELGAAHFVKTSGQDGLHVMLPLAASIDHDDARTLAEVLARTVVAELPDISTVVRPVAARGDRVYVDYLQNGRGKLIAAPFSVRPRPGAPVSTPLVWSQVTARLDPARWNIRTTPARMRKHGDPFAGVLGASVDVEALLAALGARLASRAS
jgi:bifunctional non-homologous end joining protein LigD